MLLSLSIRDFVLIEKLDLTFARDAEPGLGALTGETGAGKSILIDLPAPVSPVRTVRPVPKCRQATSSNAKLRIVSSRSTWGASRYGRARRDRRECTPHWWAGVACN